MRAVINFILLILLICTTEFTFPGFSDEKKRNANPKQSCNIIEKCGKIIKVCKPLREIK